MTKSGLLAFTLIWVCAPQFARSSEGNTPQPSPTPQPQAIQASPSPSPLPADRVVSLAPKGSFDEGDRFFLGRGDPENARKAVTLFREYHKRWPGDPGAAWRTSMGCYYFGLHLAKDDDEKKIVFAEGRDAGENAVELAHECAPCHFWTAINMALYGQTVGVFKMFFSLNSVQDHLKESIRVDPTYANAGAYRLLGLIQHKLPGILGGSNDKAREYLAKAIQTAPDEQMNYLFMVKLLVDKFDDVPLALKFAEKAMTLPKPTPDREESLGSLKELEAFLKANKPNSPAGK